MITFTEKLPPDQAAKALEAKLKLLGQIKRSIYIYRVDCGGCNGCEIEIFAGITPLFDAERFGIKVVGSPRHADILVYTGPMTRQMRMPAVRAYMAAPDPKVVVALGACGCSGGIFHDSYSVWGGADTIFPVDLYIPGCPPSPPAIIHAFAVALGLLQQKMKAEQFAEEDPAAVEIKYPYIAYDLRKQLEREARRMCGYWRGKKITDQYFEFLKEKDPKAVVYKLKELLDREQDPRLTEVCTNLHNIYLNYLKQ
jgi:hypothetical protein